jgi:hypothetical protein
VTAAAQRVGIEPEDLDAFTNALSGTRGHPAVGAGGSPSGLTRRIASIGESARFRGARVRHGELDAIRDVATRAEGTTSPAEAGPSGSRGADNGFWSDPLPDSERAREPAKENGS